MSIMLWYYIEATSQSCARGVVRNVSGRSGAVCSPLNRTSAEVTRAQVSSLCETVFQTVALSRLGVRGSAASATEHSLAISAAML